MRQCSRRPRPAAALAWIGYTGEHRNGLPCRHTPADSAPVYFDLTPAADAPAT